MKTILFNLFRFLSLLLVLPAIIVGIPSLIMISISDYFDTDPIQPKQ